MSRVLVLVFLVALAFGGLAYSGTRLWMSPEARGYVVLAGDLANGRGFADDLFLVRTPGYPLLLAGLFQLFREQSPRVLHILQHGMVVAAALFTASIAWQLTRQAWVAFIAGCLTACDLHLLAFAGMVMSEVPFALTSIAALYLLLRFHVTQRMRWLMGASLMIGVSYHFRPIGLSLAIVAALGALLRPPPSLARTASEETYRAVPAQSPRSRAVALVCGLLPACLMAGVWLGYLSNRTAGLGPGFGPSLFGRLVTVDRLDSDKSETWAEMHQVVEEAKAAKLIDEHADPRREGTVVGAYTVLGRATYPEICSKMHRVGVDLLRENLGLVLRRTLVYSFWTLVVPDSSYRFLPGGAKGRQLGQLEWARDADAEIFDCATYDPMMRPLITPYGMYMPLDSGEKAMTPFWRSLVVAYHRGIERGWVPIVGTVHGLWMVICAVGAAAALRTRNSGSWLLLVAVILVQVGGSVALVGPMPRYAVPARPLLGICGVWWLASVASAAARLRCRRRTSSELQLPANVRAGH